jgi:hypothetical protein
MGDVEALAQGSGIDELTQGEPGSKAETLGTNDSAPKEAQQPFAISTDELQ